MITADQLLCHAIGDYVIQSDWMANEKTKRSVTCAAHVLTYAVPFLFLRPSIAALVVIVVSHFVIDRWRLARFVIATKNWMLQPFFGRPSDAFFRTPTGSPDERPAWMSVWLLIIVDNVLHVLINGAALRYL